MRIAVNTRLLLPGKLEGIGWFAHETLSRITRDHSEHEFHFLFDRSFDEQFIYARNIKPHVVPPPTRHPLLYRFWFGVQIPRMLRKLKADVFLSPDGFLSLGTSIPQLPVIHDLNFEAFPEDLPRAYRNYYRHYFPRFAKKASRIVTVSEFSAADIATRYGVPRERIDVVHNGVSEVFRPSTEDEKRAARERYAQGAPYFICVGSLHPRKNIARLLLAFDRLATTEREVRLVIVGESFWWDARMKEAWEQVSAKDRVLFTGRLAQRELRDALGGATALAYVSYYEGFGIPVAEAMRCAVPVVAARATSLPEVAGDAAVYCDPFDIADMAASLERVLNDSALCEQLGREGTRRSARYTWDRTAEGLWNNLEKLLSSP
ncbi:MAG: glycosyltransferase family 4 protein [Flavobacteriales bacterium]|nr:glycosyltransferase family 4 protein [Flavobacteriales bacterium]